MLSSDDVLQMQRDQYSHDQRNHWDILTLHKTDRLKHYGLHYCKYVGRVARGVEETKELERTLIDTTLVSLSAANTLHQRLGMVDPGVTKSMQIDPLRPFADAAGRFADACEKIDHLEEFLAIATTANSEIFLWSVRMAGHTHLDMREMLKIRRAELKGRHFYIEG